MRPRRSRTGWPTAYQNDWALDAALRATVAALAGPDRTLEPGDLEVAVLARGNGRRAFRRLAHDELAELLGGPRKSRRADRAPRDGVGGRLRQRRGTAALGVTPGLQ